MDKVQKNRVSMVIYIVIFLITSAPVFCGYVLESGDAAMWMDRIQELRQGLEAGHMSWYPSAEFSAAHGSGAQAFDNGIWLLPMVGMQLLGMGGQKAYCLFLALASAGTMAAVYWMMRAFSGNRAVILCGVLFYMSCPYRIYVYFDKADLGQVIVWGLVPVLAGALARAGQGGRKIRMCGIAAAAYAGIWYADARMGVVIGGCVVMCLLFWRHRGLLSLAAGGIAALPAVIYLANYLVRGGMDEWNLPQVSIMKEGYSIGQFLSNWVYQPDRPGLGFGLMGALLLLLWLGWNRYLPEVDKNVKGMLAMAGILALAALKYFPWDYVQRLGMPFLRMIGLLETTGIFWGCANMLLVIPAAWTVGEVRKRPGSLWRWAVPGILMCAALGLALYLCNSLMYVRPPLGVEPLSTVVY